DILQENQTVTVDNKAVQTEDAQRNSPHRNVSSQRAANAAGSVNSNETSNVLSLVKDQSQSGNNGSVKVKETCVSVPVRVMDQALGEGTAQSSERREAVMVYSNQVKTDKADTFNEQTKTIGRAGAESVSSTASLNGVIESLKGKGGTMEDQSGGFNRPENMAALKAQSVNQVLPGESSSIRSTGVKSETPVQSANNTMFTNQTEMIGKITQAARLTSSPGTSEISMKLEPDHLGQMKVRLSINENQFVSARIQVESHEARSLIENSIHRLRDSLAEHGLKIEKFSVDVRQEQNPQQQGQQSALADRENNSRSRAGYFSNDGTLAAEKEPSFVPEEKTGSTKKLGYNTLEWVA
ncbi:flagellar hook-length control protein FliK, partial [Gemmatimonadota bacterium]